jgi:DHA2 family multidrug resistance protein-like MFS transporter
LSDPLIDLRLFQFPAFTASIGTQLVALTAMAGIYLFVAQYMQLVLGMSPLEAGLWTLPWTVAGMIASMLTPAIARRFNPAYVMGAGLVIAAVGMSLLTVVGNATGFGLVLASFLIIPTGLNPAMTLTTDMIMTVAPADRAGAASAISETSSELGLALGMAILGSIGTASYRRIMAQDLVATLPADTAETARSTLGGAASVAERLGGPAGAELLATARAAFAQSLEVVAAIAAVMVLATAVFAVVVLRRVTPGTSAGESDLSAAA